MCNILKYRKSFKKGFGTVTVPSRSFFFQFTQVQYCIVCSLLQTVQLRILLPVFHSANRLFTFISGNRYDVIHQFDWYFVKRKETNPSSEGLAKTWDVQLCQNPTLLPRDRNLRLSYTGTCRSTLTVPITHSWSFCSYYLRISMVFLSHIVGT